MEWAVQVDLAELGARIEASGAVNDLFATSREQTMSARTNRLIALPAEVVAIISEKLVDIKYDENLPEWLYFTGCCVGDCFDGNSHLTDDEKNRKLAAEWNLRRLWYSVPAPDDIDLEVTNILSEMSRIARERHHAETARIESYLNQFQMKFNTWNILSGLDIRPFIEINRLYLDGDDGSINGVYWKGIYFKISNKEPPFKLDVKAFLVLPINSPVLDTPDKTSTEPNDTSITSAKYPLNGIGHEQKQMFVRALRKLKLEPFEDEGGRWNRVKERG